MKLSDHDHYSARTHFEIGAGPQTASPQGTKQVPRALEVEPSTATRGAARPSSRVRHVTGALLLGLAIVLPAQISLPAAADSQPVSVAAWQSRVIAAQQLVAGYRAQYNRMHVQSPGNAPDAVYQFWMGPPCEPNVYRVTLPALLGILTTAAENPAFRPSLIVIGAQNYNWQPIITTCNTGF